jgi:peptide/nickel transport system permease protein
MARLILTKSIRALLTVMICVTFVFIILRVAGDPVRSLLPDDTPPAVLDEYRERLGLDRPLVEQYPATLQLGSAAMALALLLGLPLGTLAAFFRNTIIDRAVMAAAVFGHSVPHFFLGIVLILLFAMEWRLLPSSGYTTWQHMILPVFTLGTAAAGTIARFARTSMVEVLGQPFVRTALGKGASRMHVITRHALPNAAIPIVTVIGFQLGGLVGGALVTETVFAWPGVGRLLVTAVGMRDLAVVQTIVLLVATTMVGANYLVDIAYGLLDPRIRASNSAGTPQ